jgi:hypothetical protein
LQEFTTAIEQLAHSTHPTLPKEQIRKEAGKVFTDRVEDFDIKIQLLLGGEKTVNEALRQALKIQALIPAARTFWRNPLHPTRRRDTRKLGCWSCGEPGHFWGNCLTEGRQKMPTSAQKHEERPPRDTREPLRKSEWRLSNNREAVRSGDRRKKANTGIYIKAAPSRVDCHYKRADPSLVTKGWVSEKPCLVIMDTGRM